MRKLYPVLLIAAMIVLSIAAYPRLPDQVPMHWDAHGNVNGYGSKLAATAFVPMLMVVVFALMRALPSIDPRRANYAKMGSAYELVVSAALTIVAVGHVMVVSPAFGWTPNLGRAMPGILGALFVVIGNVLPQARPNWFFGIRTPWTLSNDRVWERTHRFGGYLLVAAGVVTIAAAFLSSDKAFTVLTITVLGAALGSAAYSFVAWKQELRGAK